MGQAGCEWIPLNHTSDNPGVNAPAQQPLSQSLHDLTRCREIAAFFRAGSSGNDHCWELRSPAGELLALTHRVHSGGRVAQLWWKLVSATGMDAGNDIHVELRGADSRVLATISSTNDAPAVVTVADEAGRLVARSTRAKTALLRTKHPDTLTVHDADGGLAAQVECEGDSPWQLRSADGGVLGELLAGQPGPSLIPRWYTWIDPKWALSDASYSRGQHLGVRRVMQYSCALTGEPPSPLALALLPLLAGLSY